MNARWLLYLLVGAFLALAVHVYQLERDVNRIKQNIEIHGWNQDG